MKRVLTALVAVTTIGAAVLVTSSPADAWGRWGWGWGWGPFWGGVAAGAIVGGAVATAPYYYGGYYGYPYGPYGYYGCRPVWNGFYWVRGCY